MSQGCIGASFSPDRRRLVRAIRAAAGCAVGALLLIALLPATAAAATARAALYWESNGTDLDLHAYDTKGHHSDYLCPNTAADPPAACGPSAVPRADLSDDVTDSGGPERFTDNDSPSTRTFVFGVCDYREASPSTGTLFTLVVFDPDGTAQVINGHLQSPQTGPQEGHMYAISPENGSYDLVSGNPCNESFRPDREPVCESTSEIVPRGGSATVGFTCTDPDGDPLTFTRYPGFPQHGTFTAGGGGGGHGVSGTYRPNAGYQGDDLLLYIVRDPEGLTTAATVSLHVLPGTGTQPEAGDTANVKPLSGEVAIKLPGDPQFSDIDRGAQIPIGSQIDTTDGEIRLRTDTGQGSGQNTVVQAADFRAGLFKLTQARDQALVTLRLRGAFYCPASPAAGRTARSGPQAQVSRKRRRLWGRGRGRFRTRGRHGAASVRGTEWLTEDNCGGTYFKAKTGTVSVTDFRTHRTFRLSAPGSYLAKKP